MKTIFDTLYLVTFRISTFLKMETRNYFAAYPKQNNDKHRGKKRIKENKNIYLNHLLQPKCWPRWPSGLIKCELTD